MATHAEYLYNKFVGKQIELDCILDEDIEPLLIGHSISDPDHFTLGEWEALMRGDKRVQTEKGLYVRTLDEKRTIGTDDKRLSQYRGKILRMLNYTHESILL